MPSSSSSDSDRPAESVPAVSVIVPVYNREDTISACLGSIANQTLAPSEIVIVNDGSTDQTSKVIESWIEAQNCTIRYHLLNQENQGKSAALNAGVAAASSEWIAFNDSDDFWLPHKLETQFALLRQDKETLVCVSDSRFINDPSLTETNFRIRGFDKLLSHSGRLGSTYRELATNPNGIFMQSLVAHRSCIEKVFPLDPSLRVAQDIDLIFRLSLASDFAFVLEPLVEIDRTPARSIGLTKQHDMKSLFRLQTKERILLGWLAIEDQKITAIRPSLNRQLAVVQRRIAAHHQQQGETQTARQYYRAAYDSHSSITNLGRMLLNRLSRKAL